MLVKLAPLLLFVGTALPAQATGMARAELPESGPARRNNIYLPTSEALAAQLGEGDQLALGALAGGPGQAGQWTSVFEAWRSALVDSQPGDSVPVGLQLPPAGDPSAADAAALLQRWPDRDGSFARRTESVENAVLRRLCGLDPTERRAWADHFRPLAEERAEPLFVRGRGSRSEGDRALRSRALVAIEREFPCTRSATRAALWLFEEQLERGRPRSAWVWLERADLHAQLLGEAAYLAAVESRRSFLMRVLQAPTAPTDAWPQATTYEPLQGHPLTLPNRTKPRSMARIEGQPGLAFLRGGAVLVQTTGTCWMIGGEEEDRIFEPWRLGLELEQPIPRSVNRTGRDWPFYPLAGDVEGTPDNPFQDIFIVSGRADGQTSNLLQRIRPPVLSELPRPLWSLGGAGLFQEGGLHLPLDQVLEPGMWEFQPGPILVEGTLFVQARRWITTESDGLWRANAPGEAQTWLLALDASTGRPRWTRFLCRGTDITSANALRLMGAELIRTPAQPLRATGRMVFVGTNLGAAFLVDLADGRLVTSFANDRREDTSPGWRSALAPNPWEGGLDPAPVLLWAPADGEELYGLRATLDLVPRGGPRPTPQKPPTLVPDPPLARGESLALLGGTPREVLVLGKAGARRTVSAHDLRTGARRDSIYLAREEKPIPGSLTQGGRLLFATDRGLYRLDRNRELYLEEYQALRMTSDFAPGGLFARGRDLYLLAAGALFHFRCK